MKNEEAEIRTTIDCVTFYMKGECDPTDDVS